MRLKDRVVLVTGASRGVGAAVAEACAREGAHLVLAAKSLDAHPKLPGTLRETAALVRALGREALVVQVDVRDEREVDGMIDAAIGQFGRIDALVNNAGAIHVGPVADWTARRFDLVNAVNVRGSFLCARAAIPHIRKQGGHILMMSPPINGKGAVGKAPYAVSKMGMTMLAQAIDAEENNIAGHALWPVTAIKTAATEVHGIGDEASWRLPAILADATVALLARDPATCRFRAWLDEEVLAEEGITDLSHYACIPGAIVPPISIQLVDPDWVRRS